MNIPQSAFQSILQSYNINLNLYSEMISNMEVSTLSNEFIHFDLGSCRSNRISHMLSRDLSKSSFEDAFESETESEKPVSSTMNKLLEPVVPIYSDIEEYDFKHYAAIYFQREKPRIFHSFSLDDLISYNPRVPLLPLLPQSLETNSILEVERMVLMLMHVISYDDEDSDESNEDREDRVTKWILYNSLRSQDIFDEIICYLMKQTNKNPDESSQIQGYRLLYLLLSFRRPSYHLFEYVLNYIYLQLASASIVGSLAWAIMEVLLDDKYQPEETTFSNEKYDEAKQELYQIGDQPFVTELYGGMSVESVNKMEENMRLLLRHGILPPNQTCYAWNCTIRILFDLVLM